MSTVRQVLQSKGAQQVWSISPTATVFQALELMAAKDIGALLIVDEAGKLGGIFSERDYARKVILRGLSSKTSKIGEVMTSKVFVIDPDKTVEDCMQIMTSHKIRHLPVLENDKLVGLISIGDVVKNLISQQQFTIEQLEQYIVGPSYPGE